MLTGLILLTACSTGTAAVEASCDPSSFVSATPLVIAHASGNIVAPGNTMLALQTGFDMGADVLDLDLRMTSDGIIVGRHDRELANSTDGSGPIDETTWAEASELDASLNWADRIPGEQVPMARLDEALLAFPDVMFSLEIKQTSPSLAEPLCEVLRETSSTDRVFVASDFDEAAYGFQDVCSETLITTTYTDLDNRQAAVAAGLPWCAASPIGQPPARAGIDAARVAESHDRGTALFVWTINDEATIRVLAEAGVDGIYTDRPDLARRVIDEMVAAR